MTPILSSTLLRTQSDARLVMLTRDGHERAFEAIVERYRRALHRYLRRMLPESRSEDALQQTFIKAWSSLAEGGAEVRDLKPWLYRIAHNTALDALKRSGYDYDELHESLHSPHATEGDHERRAVMRETLAGVAALPDRQREALLRVAVEGQSRAQVAHDLGLSDGAVRQLVHRARMTLRAAATAVTPLPLAAWAAAAREHHAPIAQRVAELAAGGGTAGGAGLLLKGGAVIVAAGVLAVGPSALGPDDRASGDQTSAAAKVAGAAAIASRVSGQPEPSSTLASGKALGNHGFGADSSGRRRAVPRRGSDDSARSGGDDPSGGGTHDAAGEDRHGSHGGESASSSGPGPSGGDQSGSGSGGGEDHSGPGSGGGEDHSGPGSGGSGSSGSGSSGSGDSGSGSGESGSGSGGSGSGSSGSGDGGSGSGISGSGSGSSGSGSSGSGSSGSGGSGRRDVSPDDGRR